MIITNKVRGNKCGVCLANSFMQTSAYSVLHLRDKSVNVVTDFDSYVEYNDWDPK